MLDRTVSTFALTTALLVPGLGCSWAAGNETPVIESEDVRIEIAGHQNFRRSQGPGDVYQLAQQISTDVNGWVIDVAVGASQLVHDLSRYPETSEDGSWRVYGPHDDEQGKDGAWMVRVQGGEDVAQFEVYVGRRGASSEQMAVLLEGEIAVEAQRRDGAFTIDFDTLYQYADILDGADDEARYGGAIEVTFARDTDTDAKRVALDFAGFFYDDGEDDLDFDGEHYVYRRDDAGAGQFHFATRSSFEQPGWSGPQLERMVVDMRWNAEQAGRARGMVVALTDQGDLLHGDLEIHECFESGGELRARWLNEEYAVFDLDYSFGDEESCVFALDALEPGE